MRLSSIDVIDGWITFTAESELYEITHGGGRVDFAVKHGFVCLGDGGDYLFSPYELTQLEAIQLLGGDGEIPNIDDPVKRSISHMLAKGDRLELPSHTVFNNYVGVKNLLEKAGGVYSKNGFTFKRPAIEIYKRVVSGQDINFKKQFQFFRTPEALARKLIELANLTRSDRVLEPSAGDGAIADLIRELIGHCYTVELMPENVQILKQKGYHVIEADFLQFDPKPDLLQWDDGRLGDYTKIVANPPFTQDQDIKHIQHMYKFLAKGGRIVTLASQGWQTGTKKAHESFRDWLSELGATVIEIPNGAFRESGTMIGSVIIIIDKPDV